MGGGRDVVDAEVREGDIEAASPTDLGIAEVYMD